RALLRRLTAEHGITVFLSSHLLAEIELIATHLGVLDAGRLLFQGTLDELRRRAPSRLVIGCDDPERARQELQSAGETISSDGNGKLVVALREKTGAQINRFLVERGIGVERLAPDDATLESLFLALTRGEASRP
ncbi:MAG TPA: bacitracin ABC transporter ATP-binding protein, partial [Thermoanaerobaculia bacterium]|nr:bacitracin ABC transporter ATP-binding protein [Thermoanaerobaculia bacterium]